MLPVFEFAVHSLDLVRDVDEAIETQIRNFAPRISQNDHRLLVPEYLVIATLLVRNQIVGTVERLSKANVVPIVRLSVVVAVRLEGQVDVHEQ